MRKLLYLLLATLLMTGCGDEYDDSALRDDLKDLSQRIEAAQASLSAINNDLKSYQTLIGSLHGARYITSVGETEGSVTITYNDGTTITLTPGTKGETGDIGPEGAVGEMGKISMPLLKIDPTDGYWYISYDGSTWQLLLDTEGNPVQGLGDKGQTGSTGADGAQGTAPTLGIDEQGFWTIDLHDGRDRCQWRPGGGRPEQSTHGILPRGQGKR